MNSAIYTDNRDADLMLDYQEQRIEALMRRVKELERENADLRETTATTD